MKSLKILTFFVVIQFCLFFAGCVSVFGQYRFDTWTNDNGLPQNGVRDITQTPDGYLWFTTFDGLVRFDGVKFTVFNKGNTKGIINNRFTGLFTDGKGTLYATTMEDGVLTIYHDGKFTSYNSAQVPGHYIQIAEPDANGEMRFLVEDEVRTSKSWYFLREGKFVFDETQEKYDGTSIYQSKSGAVWTITLTEAVERRGAEETVYPIDLGKINFRPNIFEDSAGNLWIGGNNVHRLRGGTVEVFAEERGFINNSLYHSFWEEADGGVWFASGGGSSSGIGLLQYKDGQMHVWGKEQGLANYSIQSVFKDSEDTVWLATEKGLSRLRKEIIHAYSTADGIEHAEVYPLFRDSRENIWIGSSKGLTIYRDGKFEPLDLKTADKNAPLDERWRKNRMSVQSFWEDANGKMWIGLNGGIFIVENGEAKYLENSRGHHVLAIKADRTGKVWAATNKGLLLYRDYKYIKTYTVKDGLPNEFMTFIFEDKQGNLWFGGYGGLTKMSAPFAVAETDKNAENVNFDHPLPQAVLTNYTTKEGLTGNYVRTIYEDSDGTFWIGTYDEGMSRFKDGKFINYKAEDGLYSNGVFAIQEDKNGYFWISSNRGIYRVKRSELNDFADGKLTKINSVGYGKQDGMLSSECNGGRQPATITDKDGKFWFPTQDGVVVVDSQAETPNTLAPSVTIEDVLVERTTVNFQNGVQIEPHQRNIEINFTGISLIKSEQIKFKYKLEGHDADWIDAGTRRTAYYSYLPHGKYRFLVKAANSDGVWNETGAGLNIELKPFFYQTKAFILLCVAVGALSLFLVWQFSVYQLKARQRKLAKLIDARTAELKKANDELHALANSDGLTKIGNRRRFEQFLADEWHRAVRFKTEISLVLLDIDHFKLYNDTYGHQTGDECLQKVAEALAATIKRPTDLVARFGGEEFAIVLGGTDAEGALNIAEQAVENVKNLKIPHSSSETFEHITVSVGIATVFANFETTEADLIKIADKALYQAKESGRNQIVCRNRFTQKISVLEEEFIRVG
jgi:diguanylate cyclase (GGDEF)-like protein